MNNQTNPYEVDVSIVLGTKDRAALLDQMLTSLKEAVGAIRYEMIVMEGNSSDNTREVLAKHGIRHIYDERQVLGPGRHSWAQICNFGFSRARGRWGMYGSDDILFGRNCLEKAVHSLKTKGEEIAGGLFFYKNINTRPDWDRFGIDFTYGQKLLMNYGIFRLDLFRQIGGLSEQYKFYCADGDMCYRFYRTGRQFIVIPDAFVIHNNVLDYHKARRADISHHDIALYKQQWRHFVSTEPTDPKRLLWHQDYIPAFTMPAGFARVPASTELYWHGLAYFQYGQWTKAKEKFQQALAGGLDHAIVQGFIRTCENHDLPACPVCTLQPILNTKSTPPKPRFQTSLDRIQAKGLWRAGRPLRLHLGCGQWRFDGYVNIDYPPAEHTTVKQLGADLHTDITTLSFPPQTVDEIRLHHVFEHFNRVTALALLVRWADWLRIGGLLRIETPDLMGSARTLLSDASWRTKMAVVRHLAGDQAARWAYHLDHWFAERFTGTLEKLGFGQIETQNSAWPHEPYLSNVEVTTIKTTHRTREEQLRIADELLWESVVSPKERPMWDIWRNQLREMLSVSAQSDSANNGVEEPIATG
ncbi:MAG: glycosyltransferase [Sedimentisphaerales bacterium]|nr:glycosyltransferase [Sedimentisphaerales bacterium]